MGDVVTVDMPLDLMRGIEAALEECAQDLSCEIDARYPENLRQQYPSYKRKYSNDMEVVHRSEKLVQAIRSQRWWSGRMDGDQADG